MPLIIIRIVGMQMWLIIDLFKLIFHECAFVICKSLSCILDILQYAVSFELKH